MALTATVDQRSNQYAANPRAIAALNYWKTCTVFHSQESVAENSPSIGKIPRGGEFGNVANHSPRVAESCRTSDQPSQE
jgi:hypothetical protein